MKNERMLLQLGGIGAVCYGGLLLVYLIVLLLSFRLEIIPVGELSPDRVMDIYQNAGFAIAVFVKLFGFIFLVPAVIGIFFYIKSEKMDFAVIGFAFGVISFLLDIMVTLLQGGLVQWLAFQHQYASFSVKNDVFLIHRIIDYLKAPAFVPFIGFLGLWGAAFKRIEGYRAYFVSLFFYACCILILGFQLFYYLDYAMTSSVLFSIQTLLLAAAAILAGTLIFERGNEFPE